MQTAEPLVKEACKCLDAVSESVDKFTKAVTEARNGATPLDIDAPATMAANAAWVSGRRTIASPARRAGAWKGATLSYA